jgi:2-enoate reductase
MVDKFTRMLEPSYIGKMEVRNRLVMAPMGTVMADPDGRFSRRQIDYFAERARGGVGLIITEAVKVETRIDKPFRHNMARADSDTQVPSMWDFVDVMHGYGAKVAIQLSPGVGRQETQCDPNKPTLSASAVPSWENPSVLCRPMTVEEIREIVDACADGAARAVLAGFDAIEIHGHTGYLLDQFMSLIWNQRTDEYGGDVEGRLRFSVEIVQAIRAKVGPDIPILFRFAAEQNIPGGREIEESKEIARLLEKAGVDALDIDAGCYDSMDFIFPTNYMGDAPIVDLAAAIKQVVGIPVIGVGNMTPETAEAVIRDGKADFVALGRGLIADPDWPNKVRLGRLEDIRPCIRCNEKCIGNLFKLRAISCSVNARVGSERYYPMARTDTPKRLLVVGGGPAGMEAARTAALRGHQVTLMEKQGKLGGQLRAAGTASFKKELQHVIDWWEVQLQKLGVDVQMNTEVTADTPAMDQADAVIIACGGRPLRPKIPGIDGENVVGVLDWHLDRSLLRGDRILIAGGGLSGCDAALEMAKQGKSVTVVEMQDKVAPDLNVISRISLLRELAENNVQTLMGHRIEEFLPEGAVVKRPDGNTDLFKADTIVLAMGTVADDSLARMIMSSREDVYVVGDCMKPSKVAEAVHAGFIAGYHI